MYSTTDERGIINNFASEPKTYLAEAPTVKEQKGYLIQGMAAAILVVSVIAIAFVAS